MDKIELQTILPHRDKMFLLDSVEKEGDIAHGFYRIPADSWFLIGSTAGKAAVPSVMLCEIMAQSVCVLLASDIPKNAQTLYMGLNNVHFEDTVYADDLFETKCRITRAKKPFYFAKGQGFVGDRLCVEADLFFAVMDQDAP